MVRESFHRAMQDNPKLRKPLIAAIIVWAAMLVGAGVTVFVIGYEDHQRTDTVARVSTAIELDHNISACTFRVVLEGIRQRTIQTALDPSTSPTARIRAQEGVAFYTNVIDGQVTEPRTLDCDALLRRVRDQGIVPRVRTTS